MEIRELLAELFKLARQEGTLKKWADGLSDADEILQTPVSRRCKECGGSGGIQGDKTPESIMSCPKCKGMGYADYNLADCPRCGGAGQVDCAMPEEVTTCPACHGKKRVKVSKETLKGIYEG